MDAFFIYLRLGFEHITDWGGYDHMLFLLALCAAYPWREIRRLFWLLTAFTLGHAVTLAISTAQGPILPSDWVEFLIPVTILATCIGNIAMKGESLSPNAMRLRYVLAAMFGLIHGMGFSNYLRGLLLDNGDLFQPLLAFNIGLEAGQLLVVAVVAGIIALLVRWAPISAYWIRIFVSIAAALVAVWMSWQNLPL